jgi:hypothetical protein
MNNRLFTFGCSFTNFRWPTWADILARQFENYENWGRSGAGNFFIFNSVVEAVKRRNINKDDTVIVMWSSIAREDRYVKNHWLLSGSIYTQTIYDENFVGKFADPTGYLLRDLSYIYATRSILESTGCKWIFLSIVPLSCYEDCVVSWFSIDKRILNLYNEEITNIRPSVYEVVFNNNWLSRVGYRNFKDLEKNYSECRGARWPETWEKFVEQHATGTLGECSDEILNRFGFGDKMIRTDYHPTPIEHLAYLLKIVPEFEISNTDEEWAIEMDTKLKSLTKFNWQTKNISDRF